MGRIFLCVRRYGAGFRPRKTSAARSRRRLNSPKYCALWKILGGVLEKTPNKRHPYRIRKMADTWENALTPPTPGDGASAIIRPYLFIRRRVAEVRSRKMSATMSRQRLNAIRNISEYGDFYESYSGKTLFKRPRIEFGKWRIRGKNAARSPPISGGWWVCVVGWVGNRKFSTSDIPLRSSARIGISES